MLFYILLLFACQLAGEFFVYVSGLSIPGPVCGMLILLLGFFLNGGIPEELSGIADNFLSNLSLLYVPAGVGIIVHASNIANEWLPISIGLIVSTILTIAVTGLFMAWLSGDDSGGKKVASNQQEGQS